MTQELNRELFQINDITLEVNPSDIRLLENDFAVEESYLRSSAVFAYRSKYAATKIAVTIPFNVSETLFNFSGNFKEVPSILKLILELNNYPFTFIKSKRIDTYIAPTNPSKTGYSLFAVDEINLISKSEMSNLMFLELVLVYFNHTPFVKDFKFSKYINTTSNEYIDRFDFEDTESDVVANLPVDSLADSISWQRYFSNILIDFNKNLKKFNLKLENSSNTYLDDYLALSVKLGIPTIRSIDNNSSNDDTSLINSDTVLVFSSNNNYESNAINQLYLDKEGGQDFTRNREKPSEELRKTLNKEQSYAIFKKYNDTLVSLDINKYKELVSQSSSSFIDFIKEIDIVESKYNKESGNNVTLYGSTNYFRSTQELKDSGGERGTKNDDSSFFEQSKIIAIDWPNLNLLDQNLKTYVNSIVVKRKNKLALQQIGSFKQPVIQYLGRYPAEAIINFTSDTSQEYLKEEGFTTLIHQINRVLETNRVFYPETTAHNHLKIKTLATVLLDSINLIPNQTHMYSSAEQSGTDNYTMTFIETNLEEFIKMSKVTNSGKNSSSQFAKFSHDTLVSFLTKFKELLSNKNRILELTDIERSELTSIYEKILLVSNETLREFNEGSQDLTTTPFYTLTNKHEPVVLNLSKTFAKLTTDSASELASLLGATVGTVITISLGPLGLVAATAIGAPLGAGIGYLIGSGIDATNRNRFYYGYVLKVSEVQVPGKVVGKKLVVNKELTVYNKYVRGSDGKVYLVTEYPQNLEAPKGYKWVDVLSDKVKKKEYNTDISKFHIELIDQLIKIINGRKAVVTNQLVNKKVAGLEFRENIITNNIIKEAIAFINIAGSNGLPVAKEVLNSYSDDFLLLLDEQYSSFVGQAIPDLKLERLQKNYIEETDVSVQTINPFFFLIEEKWLDKSDIEKAFKTVTDVDDALEEASFNSFENELETYLNEEPKIDRIQGLPLTDMNYSDATNLYSKNKLVDAKYTAATLSEEQARQLAQKNLEEASLKGQSVITNSPSGYNPTTPVVATYQKFKPNNIKIDFDKAFHKKYYDKHIASLGIKGLTFERWLLYVNGLAQPESSYKYNAKTRSGTFIGIHQINRSYLKTFGILTAKESNINLYLSSDGADLQAEAIAIYTKGNFNQLARGIRTIRDKPVEEVLAILAAAHLTGASTAISLVNSNFRSVSKDDNKVSNTVYYSDMYNLQTKDYRTFIKSDDVSISTASNSEISEITLEVTNVLSGNSFISNGVTYYLEGSVGLTESGLIQNPVDNGVALSEVSNKFTEALRKTLKMYNNRVNAKVVGVLTPTSKIIKATVNSGNSNSNLNLTVLENGWAFLDPNFANTAIYQNATTKAINNKAGVYALNDKFLDKSKIAKTLDTVLSDKGRTYSNKELDVIVNSLFTKSYKDDINKFLKPTQCPVLPKDNSYYISSGYGRRVRNGKTKHKGIDIVSRDGINNREVITLAEGRVVFQGFKKSYGNLVIVEHANGYTTRYGHLNSIYVKDGQKLAAGSKLGTVGSTGDSTGPHLHYEILYNNIHLDPYSIINLNSDVGSGISNVDVSGNNFIAGRSNGKPNITEEIKNPLISIYNESFLVSKYIESINSTMNRGLSQAFPTIKVYVTVGNEDQEFWQGLSGANIEYYEIKGIRNFHINTNNSNNPIDVLRMVIADPNFLLTDEMSQLANRNNIDIQSIGTDYELQFKNNRLKLQPGMKLHIRIGYDNNPNNLDIVFNGSVVSATNLNSTSIEIIAESFGKELLSEVLGTTEPVRLGGGWNSSTGSIFADLMQLPSIYHFGKTYSFLRMALTTELGDLSDPEAKSLTGSGTFLGGDSSVFNSNYYLGFKLFSKVIQRSRIYTNIYSADIEHVDSEFDEPVKNLFSAYLAPNSNRGITYDFFAVRETPWEVMKQMEYRHPGTFVKPMWYQDRCTLFFGTKEQSYIARDSDKTLMSLAAINKSNNSSILFTENEKISNSLDTYAKIRTERMEPAVGFHIISSESNLISNSIKLNSNYYTRVNVGFRDDNDDINQVENWGLQTMSLDDNLATWEVRATDLNLSGCDKRYMAFRYGTSHLLAEAEKMYSGSIFIIGNPKMKSGDYVYLEDTTKRLFGIIKVRECYHHFDDKQGFVTEIVPGQYVEPAEFVRSTLFLRLGLASRLFMQNLKGNILTKAFSSQNLDTLIKYLNLVNEVNKLSRSHKDINLGNPDDWFGFNIIDRSKPALYNSYLDSYLDDLYYTGTVVGTSGIFYMLTRSTLSVLARATNYQPPTLLKLIIDIGSNIVGGISFLRKNTPNALRTARLIVGAPFVLGVKNLGSYWLGTARAAGARGVIIGTAKFLANVTLSSTILAGRAGLTVLLGAAGGPFGIALLIISTLAFSWTNAKIEQNQYTRQPVLFYPLIKHGKPYIGGMTGVVKNAYMNSLISEGEKTSDAVRRAATIINKRRLINGQDRLPFTKMLERNDILKNRVSFKTDDEGRIIMNVYANDAQLQRQQDSTAVQ